MRLFMSPPGGDVPSSPAPNVMIACPGWTDVDRIDEPFDSTAARWRDDLKALQARDAVVSICTVFRHIRGRAGLGVASPVLERIRRLNRLVIGLSHDPGAGVIDIDRAFAHIGGQNLRTDYRLSGDLAAEFAGHTIALHLLSYSLEEMIDPELLGSARNVLGSLHDLIARRLCRPTPYSPPGSSRHG